MKFYEEHGFPKKRKKGYGKIGRPYGCIKSWYGNLLGGNFQIHRNSRMKDGPSGAKFFIYIYKTRGFKTRPRRKRIGAEIQWKLF